MKTCFKMSWKRIMNFMLIFSMGILCFSTAHANIVRAVQTGGERAGKVIGDIIHQARDSSPNRPVYEMLEEMGFNPGEVPRDVVKRMTARKAIDNPMNYFYDDTGRIYRVSDPDVIDYDNVFFSDKNGLMDERVLKTFISKRLRADNDEHVKMFWESVEEYFASMETGEVVLDGVVDKMRLLFQSSGLELPMADLVAKGIKLRVIDKSESLVSLLRKLNESDHGDIRIFSSSYFDFELDAGSFGYEIVRGNVNKMGQFLTDESFDFLNLWKKVNEVKDLDEGYLLTGFTEYLQKIIKEEGAGHAGGLDGGVDGLAQAFEKSDRLQVIAEAANNSEGFSDQLTEILTNLYF